MNKLKFTKKELLDIEAALYIAVFVKSIQEYENNKKIYLKLANKVRKQIKMER